MSLSENKTLTSIEINFTTKTIAILWMEEVLKSGQVISSNPHRGAYPLGEDGEPDESVITLMGKSLADVIGDGFAVSQKNLAEIQNKLFAKQIELQQERENLTAANELVSNLQNQLVDKAAEAQQAADQISKLLVRIEELEMEAAVRGEYE